MRVDYVDQLQNFILWEGKERQNPTVCSVSVFVVPRIESNRFKRVCMRVSVIRLGDLLQRPG